MKKLILIVEHDSMRDSMRRWFGRSEEAGGVGLKAEIVTFNNPDEALKFLGQGEYGDYLILLITGGQLHRFGEPSPSMDGPQLIQSARELIGKRLRRAVVFSGLPGTYQARAHELGYLVLEKPGPMEVFAPVVADFLNLPEI